MFMQIPTTNLPQGVKNVFLLDTRAVKRVGKFMTCKPWDSC